jgi:hypothetical protein
MSAFGGKADMSLRLPQQLRQLGDIHRDPPRLMQLQTLNAAGGESDRQLSPRVSTLFVSAADDAHQYRRENRCEQNVRQFDAARKHVGRIENHQNADDDERDYQC